MRKLADMIRFYLNDERGFLGIGEDKVTTTTTGLSEADRRATERGRTAGREAADIARASDPWALGPGQGMYDAQRRYDEMYGGYGQAAGQYGAGAQDFYQRAGQAGIGIGGLGQQYADQIQGMYEGSQNQGWADRAAEGITGAGQNAFLQGAGGGSRQAVAEEMARRGVQQDQMADYGRQYANSMQQGNQFAQMDLQRMLQGAGMQQQGQFQGMQGQMGANAAGAGMQGQITGALERQNADEFNRASTAAGQELGSFGRITEQTSEQRQKGNLFGDMLSLGGMVSGFFPGGSGDQSGRFSQTGGGGYGTPSIQNSPIMSGGGLYGNYGGGTPNLGMGGQQSWGGWAPSGNAMFPMMYGQQG
jgi:hypothetical protein